MPVHATWPVSINNASESEVQNASLVCAIQGPSTSQRASLDCRECIRFAYELCTLTDLYIGILGSVDSRGFWEAWRNHLTVVTVQARHGLSIADAFKVAFLLEQQASLT